MHRQKSLPPFRELLFDIRDQLLSHEFQQLKDYSKGKLPEWKWANLPQDNDNPTNRNELFTALEESRALAEDNLTFLRSSLRKLNRGDLIDRVDKLQEKTKVKRSRQLVPQYTKLCGDIIKGLRTVEFEQLKESSRNKVKERDWAALNVPNMSIDKREDLFIALEENNNLGPDNLMFLIDSLEKIGRNDLAQKLHELDKATNSYSVFNWKLMVLVGAVFAVASYQILFPGLTYIRMWWCCWGAIHPQHTLEFDMTTMDIQRARIHGVEYEWAALKKKLHLNFEKHQRSDMHYYLNLERCGAGGVRYVHNWLFNLPQVRGAEVFAVDDKCEEVYYQDNNVWNKYRSAVNVMCSHHGPRAQAKHSSRHGRLLDDKIDAS